MSKRVSDLSALPAPVACAPTAVASPCAQARLALCHVVETQYCTLRQRLAYLLECDQLAGDVLHDVYMRLCTHAVPTHVRDAKGYVLQMALNRAKDHHRAYARTTPLDDCDDVLLAEPGLEPERRAQARHALRVLDLSLQRLPARCHALICGMYVDGEACEALGRRWGLSTAAVRREIRRGLRACRKDCDEVPNGASQHRMRKQNYRAPAGHARA